MNIISISLDNMGVKVFAYVDDVVISVRGSILVFSVMSFKMPFIP